MRAITTILLSFLILGLTFAKPQAHSSFLERRQTGGGTGGGGDNRDGNDADNVDSTGEQPTEGQPASELGFPPPFTRPEEWNDLPTPPPNIVDALYKQARLYSLMYIKVAIEEGFFDQRLMRQYLANRLTYLPQRAIRTTAQTILDQFMQRSKNSRRLAIDPLLNEFLGSLNLDEIEREMEAIVKFREENEAPGTPGQEAWRAMGEDSVQPDRGLPSPFSALTSGHSCLLAVMQARDGSLSREEARRFVQERNPFLADNAAEDIISRAYISFGPIPTEVEEQSGERPSVLGRVRNWFGGIFGRGDVTETGDTGAGEDGEDSRVRDDDDSVDSVDVDDD